MRAQEAEETKL